MPVRSVPRYFDSFGVPWTICWDGKGDNLDGCPECDSNNNPQGEGGGAGGVSPVDQSIAKKLQGRQEWTTESNFFIDGEEKIIDSALIKEIYIEEDVFSPFIKGYVVVDLWNENLEREPQKPLVPYIHFRNDARDEYVFELKPNETPENPEGLNFPPEYWTFKQKYVIYDKEDIGDKASYKLKKFYFWDKNYQLLRERKIQWSTGIGTRFISDPPKEPIAHQPDFVRSMLTGEAMASLIWDAGLGEFIDFDNWDWGSTYINYSLKAQETVWDALCYIYERHVSKNFYDQCLFTKNRFTRKYQLIPYYKVFEYAGDDPNLPGPWQREHLFFEEESDGLVGDWGALNILSPLSIISPWKAPLLNDISNIIDIKMNQWGFITNYHYTDMAGIDSSLAMVSKPVHTHWNKKKQFIMNFENNEIEKVREDFIKPFRIDYVLGKFPLYTLNKTKKDQIAINHRYSLESSLEKESDAIMRLNKGKNEIAFSNLYLNQSMGLTLYGSTHRQAGMWIGIDRYGWSDNDFDWKICGQWFVTRIVHHHKHNKYVNHISMVKLHAYDEFKKAPDEDVI